MTARGEVVGFPRPDPGTPAGQALAARFPSTARAHLIAGGRWTSEDEDAWDRARGWVFERPVERDAVVRSIGDAPSLRGDA